MSDNICGGCNQPIDEDMECTCPGNETKDVLRATVSRLRAALERTAMRHDAMTGYMVCALCGAYEPTGGVNHKPECALAPPDKERPNLADVLRNHWPTIICDHDAKTDRAQCSCCTYEPPTCSSVGDAVETWVQHILGLL